MHLMVDVETLGTGANAVVTEVGWCEFELDAVGLFHSSACFKLNVDAQIKANRLITWETICFWLDQDDIARKALRSDGAGRYPIEEFCSEFTNERDWATIEGVWSHGANFDLPILESLFAFCGLKTPWDYYCVRDTRTMLWLAGGMKIPKTELQHSAEADAIAQALTMQMAYAKIKGIVQW